jgi:hypothetical protein
MVVLVAAVVVILPLVHQQFQVVRVYILDQHL